LGLTGGEGRCYIREKLGWGKRRGYGKFGGGLEDHCTSLAHFPIFGFQIVLTVIV